MNEPPWINKYRDVINKLRLVLYKFEFDNIDIQSFINEINKSLVNCGYDPVKFIVSDLMTELFGAYSVYSPSKPIPRIYVSTELLGKPKALLGRVIMHEVFHHVLYQRPPTFLFKLAPKRTEPLILISIPLFILAIMATILGSSHGALPYIIAASSITMAIITALLIKALNNHELVATALVIYLITGLWVKDWTYYRDDRALMGIEWSDDVKPRIIEVQR